MIVPAKRILAALALGLTTLAVSACCGGSSKNVGATAKCQASSISTENCKNCCKAYGATSSTFTGKGSCTCR
jgi:hypothetical protein